MMRNVFFILIISSFCTPLFAQKIKYSEPQKGQVINSVSFEVIGKIDKNYLVYKNIRTKNLISVYDDDMKLINEIDLTIMPDKTLNVDFIAYPDFAWVVYQYQQRNTIYCKAFKLNDLFDAVISSSFVHLRKPDKDIFKMASDISQTAPENSLYIDDRQMFVEVAQTLGLNGLHYVGLEEAKKQLKVFGLDME